MGYDVHLTRKEDDFDEVGQQISIEEWKKYISGDSEMRLDGFAEAETSDGTLRVESEGLAVWLAWSKHEDAGDMAWMDYYGGNITVKNPDEEMLSKMCRISCLLQAKVQGDEGEVYDENGKSNWQDSKEEGQNCKEMAPQKWWQFWM